MYLIIESNLGGISDILDITEQLVFGIFYDHLNDPCDFLWIVLPQGRQGGGGVIILGTILICSRNQVYSAVTASGGLLRKREC